MLMQGVLEVALGEEVGDSGDKDLRAAAIAEFEISSSISKWHRGLILLIKRALLLASKKRYTTT